MLASQQAPCILLQGACLAGDVREVRALLHHHQRLGRRPTLQMHNTCIMMYGREKMLDEAFAVGEEIRKALGGLPQNTVLQLLLACRKVGCRLFPGLPASKPAALRRCRCGQLWWAWRQVDAACSPCSSLQCSMQRAAAVWACQQVGRCASWPANLEESTLLLSLFHLLSTCDGLPAGGVLPAPLATACSGIAVLSSYIVGAGGPRVVGCPFMRSGPLLSHSLLCWRCRL